MPFLNHDALELKMIVSWTLFPWLAPLPGMVASAATMLKKFDTNAGVDMGTLCSQDQLEPTISPCQEHVRLHVHMSKDSHRVHRESDEMKHAEEGDGPSKEKRGKHSLDLCPLSHLH